MTNDEHFISRCIELSAISIDSGDAPFGSLVTKDGKLLAEASNDKNTHTN